MKEQRIISLILMITILLSLFTGCIPSIIKSKNNSTELESKTYSITYVNAPNHNNPTTYTSDATIVLSNPIWSGLSFVCWTDKDGNVVKEIPRGTTGDITLTANWRYIENLVISNQKNELFLAQFNEKLNAYQFVYDLGTINNVVLDELSAYKYHGATNYTWSISETVSFTESRANAITSTISKSVTSSTSWASTISKAQNISTSLNTSISAEISAEWAGIGASIAAKSEIGTQQGATNTTSNSNSNSAGSSSEESQTVSSTLTFVSDTSTQVTRSETLSPNISPAGMYRYVQAATIKVFLIVTYDIESANYYINIFSCIAETFDTMLYEPVEEYNNLNILASDTFKFDLDFDGLAESVIGNSYFISYDANGGTGTMPTTTHTIDVAGALPKNAFIREGYQFAGWEYITDTSYEILQDGQTIINLTYALKTISLKALWTPVSYTIEYDANGGDGIMPSSTHTVDEYKKISANTFTKNGYEFAGWKLVTDNGEEKHFKNEETVINLTEAGNVVTLYAMWNPISAYVRDGDYIYFGEYPQTIKADDVTITSVTDDRGYYLGSDGFYYAMVKASVYENYTSYTFSSGDTIKNGTTYYFKVEPIRWRILSENGGNAFILCDNIIANGVYCKDYDNEYIYSDIRTWLCSTFYKTAFTELQKEIILITTVDNSPASTGDASNPYARHDTNDRIFLLSFAEVTNSEYGFGSDEDKCMNTSDYSRATGVDMSVLDGYYGNGYWWLRSPYNDQMGRGLDARTVSQYGDFSSERVFSSSIGIVPAMWINLNS